MQYLIDLIEELTAMASRRNDREALMAIRRKFNKIHAENPDLALRLSRIITTTGGTGATRSFQKLDQVLRDQDSGLELLQRFEVAKDYECPILPFKAQCELDRFILERKNAHILKSNGVEPPSSLALMGNPGTGKTSISRWLAGQLELPLLSLNIAAVITSYLGQTGHNIKKALDAAKSERSILLLDEFDALGSQRNSDNDVGEMKRVVTVLLQEVENWPTDSIVIAATNMPESIDIAFRRRFSKWIEIPLPDANGRAEILKRYIANPKISSDLIQSISRLLEGASGADIKEYARRSKARAIVDKIRYDEAMIREAISDINFNILSETAKKSFVTAARASNPRTFTLRKLAEIIGVSHTTISRIVNQNELQK